MKKLLILLFSLLISFNSYGEVELDFSSDTFCDQSPKVQVRNNLYYLPNQKNPYSGENICIYLFNGQYYSQGQIKEGFRDGTWSFWFENGQKKAERNYKDGKIMRKSNYKNGKIVGETGYGYYENGQIEIEVNFKDGKKDGKLTEWYENGQIEWEANYKDGKFDGKETIWYENGQKRAEKNYKDGKLDGKWTRWYENGQKWWEGNYKDGVCISGDCD